eukprot:gb/GFBE01038348.1/.p1 GENE.gb/GFBE01038348.1/~~gb/GFBE01038348.1/.p1  ORF type:complete len:311 (+),score=74.56 gb/GFBE01038348.1/:1-933(+)
MALNLRYSFTFIDVEDEKSSVDGLKVRARSLPATRRMPTSEVQEESQLSSYVTTLAQRADQLHILLRRGGNLAQLRKVPVPEPKQQQHRQQTRTETSSTELASLSTSATDTQQIVRKQQRRETFGSGVISLAGLLEEEVTAAPGSIGHPEICRRPCLYFVAGSCSNGAACGYCHMEHTQRPVHLDKHQRESLKQLRDADLLELVARLMRNRAAQLGFLPEAADVLSLMDAWVLAAEQKAASTTKAAPRPRLLAKLEHHMSKLTFSTLLGMAVRGLKTGSNEAHGDAVADALIKMRQRLAAAGVTEMRAWQ